jgi:hypothetical protein
MENFYNDNEFMSNNILNIVNIENNDIVFRCWYSWKKVYCHKWGNLCNLFKDNQVIDKLIWKFRGKSQGHEVKINVINKSILSGLLINIQNIYFLYISLLLLNQNH